VSLQKYLIQITGVVQGVGFRPFVYREATRLKINGFVCNNSQGVWIEASGDQIEPFIEALQNNAPQNSNIESVQIDQSAGELAEGFEIRPSLVSKNGGVMTPDLAMCDTCREELFDPLNRRFRHPFINCSQCGPRYSMIQMLPYDRNRTAMKHFTMCAECQNEYDDPTSRRYHTEGICCPACGPRLRLLDTNGNDIEGDPMGIAAKMLQAGDVIALKGLGGYHLLCDATNEEAVQKLRAMKHRQRKPLAVMFRSLDEIERVVCLEDYERRWIMGNVKPILIADEKHPNMLSSFIAPSLSRVGVFLPYTPMHSLLLEALSFPLVVTSANVSGSPMITDYQPLVKTFDALAGVLDHNRHIVNPCDDSLVQCVEGQDLILRLGRGLAPYSMDTGMSSVHEVIGMGAHQKSTLAVATDSGRIVLGGHIGDLETLESEEAFEKNLQTLQRIYDITDPSVIHDLHPGYVSTRYAKAHFSNRRRVQHHYAHILSVMAEYALRDRVLGFAFDGSGLGEDGRICGGEVIRADIHGYELIARWRSIRLIGGEKAIREPRKIALSMLFECYELDEVLGMMFMPCVGSFLEHEIRQMHYIWNKGLNTIDARSVGRLYDGIASLGDFVHETEYEGESGMIMEGFANLESSKPLEVVFHDGEIDWRPMVRRVVAMYHEISDPMERKRKISGGLNGSIVEMLSHYIERFPNMPIVLSGGVFQNRELVRLIKHTIKKDVYIPAHIPVNDGGIALGQVWWGMHQTHL